MRAVGHERLELTALAQQVDAVLRTERAQVRERVGVEAPAQPRLVQSCRRDLDDPDLEASVEHLAGQFLGVALPQRREQVRAQALAHRPDAVGLVGALDGTRGDARDPSQLVGEVRQRRLQGFQFRVALPPGVGRLGRLEVVRANVHERDPDALGGQSSQVGRRHVVHVGVALRVDRDQPLDAEATLQG